MRRCGGDKIYNRKKELNKKEFFRNVNNRLTIPDVIIACEDSVSSPAYFQAIIDKLLEDKVITSDSLIVPHTGKTHPVGVLKTLLDYKDSNGKSYKDFERKWIVIDRDKALAYGEGHSTEGFNNTISKAKSKKIEVAYSNDSFELWYLLHFDYRITPIMRDETVKEVVKKLKTKNVHKFSKLTKDNIKKENYTKLIFEELLCKQKVAIKNAQKLLDSYDSSHNPESDNPLTTVHKLVLILNDLKKDK